jgi:two-component system sensor histidine kinase/response regulator
LPVGLAPGQQPRRILVVDDVREGRDVAAEFLTQVGFEVRTASTGEGALEVHDAWHPDLILMDLRMPGMGGIEAMRRLKSAGSRAVLVAFTASSIAGAEEAARAVGAHDVLLKPYRESDMLHMIGRLLGLQYVYEAASLHASAPSTPATAALETELPALLRSVPAPIIEQLRAAALEARATRIEELADEVSKHSTGAAEIIRDMAGSFRYESLVEALDELSVKVP